MGNSDAGIFDTYHSEHCALILFFDLILKQGLDLILKQGLLQYGSKVHSYDKKILPEFFFLKST